MTRTQRIVKLEVAAKLVAEVAADLDRGVSNCECCNAYKYENKAHYQMGVEMDAMVRKLTSYCYSLLNGKDRDWRGKR